MSEASENLWKVPVVRVRNVADTPAPPFALLAITGQDDDGTFTVDQPSKDGQWPLLINWYTTLPVSTGEGNGQGAAFRQFPAAVLYETEDGDPDQDEWWGAKADSWKLHKGYPGFRIAGLAEGNLVSVQGISAPIQQYIGKTTSTVTARSGTTPGSGTVRIYSVDADTPELVDRGIDETAYSLLSFAIASGKYVALARDPYSGEWVVADGEASSGTVNVAESDGSPASTAASLLRFDSAYFNVVISAGIADISLVGLESFTFDGSQTGSGTHVLTSGSLNGIRVRDYSNSQATDAIWTGHADILAGSGAGGFLFGGQGILFLDATGNGYQARNGIVGFGRGSLGEFGCVNIAGDIVEIRTQTADDAFARIVLDGNTHNITLNCTGALQLGSGSGSVKLDFGGA